MEEVSLEKIIQEIVEDVLSVWNIRPDSWVRKPRATFPGCTVHDFIEKLIVYETGPEFIKFEGWGEQTFNRAVKSLLSPIFGQLHGGNETWARTLLQSIEIKQCPHCVKFLRYTAYGINKHSFAGIDSVCKSCKSKQNAAHYALSKDTYHKTYISLHRAEYTARNALRRARELKATPAWANIEKIKDIYRTCPPGYHVDHEIPLRGELVSGLHVENNLRHLPALENLKKSNKF